MDVAFGYYCVVLGLDLLLFLAWIFKVLVFKIESNESIITLAVLHVMSILLSILGLLLLKGN